MTSVARSGENFLMEARWLGFISRSHYLLDVPARTSDPPGWGTEPNDGPIARTRQRCPCGCCTTDTLERRIMVEVLQLRYSLL